MIDETDRRHLERCIELAGEALDAGDQPFGSLLVAKDGRVLLEARNRAVSVDATRHPEFEIARWAGEHLSPDARASATVYTSGEHCPMCAAAHALVGLGRIVYASSSEQLQTWLAERGRGSSRLPARPINDVAPQVVVEGPVTDLAERVGELHRRRPSN